MKRRVFGRTGLRASEIGFGCGTTARLMIEGAAAERRQAVARAIESGIDYFDTAPLYGDGRSETNLGQTLKELDAHPVVATKVVLWPEDLGDIAGSVRRSVMHSLERLQLGTLPLVHLHNRVGAQRAPKPELGVGAQLTVEDLLGGGGVAEAFEWLKTRGLVQHFGCCAFGGETAALQQVIDGGHFDTVLVSYSMLNATAFGSIASRTQVPDFGGIGARAAAKGMGTIALRVLEAGRVSGSASPGGLSAILEQSGLGPIEAAIRYALSNERVSTALVGITRVEHVEAAVEAARKGPLEPALLARIDALRQ